MTVPALDADCSVGSRPELSAQQAPASSATKGCPLMVWLMRMQALRRKQRQKIYHKAGDRELELRLW